MLPQASWTWHKLENPSACGGLGCAAGRWMTPDPSLKGWLLKDGGQLWHHAGSLCSPEQLPQHNPSQRWSQSIQCSSLIITYTSLKEIIVLQPSKWSWLMVNTVIEIQKSVKMESEIYLTKQTLISWLSALIPWCFFFLKFHGLYFCFVFPSLVFFFPFIICPHWVAPLTQRTCRAVMAPWQHADDLGGARLAPVGPDAFLHFPCSLMQHTPLKALYKVQRTWTTTTEVWVERSAAVINHLSINHCHPCCSGSPAG